MCFSLLDRGLISQPVITNTLKTAWPYTMGCSKVKSKQRSVKIPLSTFHRLEQLSSEQVKFVSPNAYAILDTNKDEHPMDTNPTKPILTSSKERIPPIKITCKSCGEVHRKIIAAGVVRYDTKIANEGIIVYTNTAEDFRTVVKHLSNTNVNFHTHQLIEDRSTKVVLSGLYDIPTKDLIKILDEEDIKPVAVKKLAIRNKKYDEHTSLKEALTSSNCAVLVH